MGLKSLMLGAWVGGRAILASAQRPGIVPFYPIRNATKLTPTATGSSCENQCAIQYPELAAISWIPKTQIIYTTKITVATVSVIVTTHTNTTFTPRTETIYNQVPSEYNLYSWGLDEQGTAVVTVPVIQSKEATVWSPVTYPTPYLAYSTEYHWQGILQTHDKESSPACATASPEPANVPLPRFPEYPQPKGTPPPDENDPFGYDYQPIWVPVEEQPNKQFFDLAFPSESAFSYCESIPSKPRPTQFEVPKFVTVTTTAYTTVASLGIGIIQSTATGWEEQTTTWGRPNVTPDIPRVLSSVQGLRPNSQEQSITPLPQQTLKPPSLPDIIISIIINNPAFRPSSSGQPQQPSPITPAPAAIPTREGPFSPQPTPVFTYISTVINGQTTTIPAFILPGSSTTATATLGQTVTINGEPTVLTPPPAIFTSVATTINGVPTSIPAYIISGTLTATIGQTITLQGTMTVLAPPPVSLSWISTTVNGAPTSSPMYVISGTSTATIGQTIVIDRTTTVLSSPTSTSGLGKPAATSGGGPHSTGLPRDGAASGFAMSWSVLVTGLGLATIMSFGWVPHC